MVGRESQTHRCGLHTELTLWVMVLLLPGEGETSYRNVNTKYGPVQGVLQQRTERLQPVATFLGIPFATPPVGNLRFMPPVTVAPWKVFLGISMISFKLRVFQRLRITPNVTERAKILIRR